MVLRVFVDPSAYHSQNAGDMAMLSVAMTRLRALWPDASIVVQTLDPQSILTMDPDARTVDARGACGWSADAFLASRSARIPRGVGMAMGICRSLRRKQPWVMHGIGVAALWLKQRNARVLGEYLDAVRAADLVVLTGAGSLNDSFRTGALIRFETLELAMRAGAATALLGQSIGPIGDPVLRARAAHVLRQVDFIALREGLGSAAFLDSMNVSPAELLVTGDDAVVLGYQAHRPELGTALGVNLRVASYSGVDDSLIEVVGAAVRSAARAHGAQLLAIPISRSADGDDLLTALRLIGAGSAEASVHGATTSAQTLDIVARCRVVVVGSYHAAVFALSMGLPAVMIASSEYYVQKLRGVAHQFAVGCHVELTSQPDFAERLRRAIDAAWASANDTRDALLAAARRQIASSEAGYRRLFEIVEARVATRRSAQ